MLAKWRVAILERLRMVFVELIAQISKLLPIEVYEKASCRHVKLFVTKRLQNYLAH